MAQYQIGEHVSALGQWPRLEGERVEGKEGLVDRGLRGGARPVLTIETRAKPIRPDSAMATSLGFGHIAWAKAMP
jgi:hypothetical protein